MRAGELNRRLHLQQLVSTTDSDGFTNETWSDLAVVWAGIDPLRAAESYQAAQSQENITHQITIRWRSDVTARMRFLYAETTTGIQRIFLIHTMLDPLEAHRQLDCMCEEFVTSQVGAT